MQIVEWIMEIVIAPRTVISINSVMESVIPNATMKNVEMTEAIVSVFQDVTFLY